MSSKQVLVVKKFSKGLRTGKYVSQGAHASVGALLSIGSVDVSGNNFVIPLSDPFVRDWIVGSFKKITCYVDSDEELMAIYNAAKNLNLPVSSIVDSGLTEFNGIPTLTAVGIGPADSNIINLVTSHLKLF